MEKERSENFFSMERNKKIQIAVVGIFFIFNIFIWAAVFRTDSRGVLTVAFLDVGQGDAIYIEAPNGNQVLIDGGPGRQVLRELGQVMPFYDRSLDVVLVTHPDQDHVGGLPAVLERMDVGNIVTTENTSKTGAYGAFEEAIQNEHASRILARAGERIILDDGVVLEILFPDRNAYGWETNTSSIVARLTYGERSFLFTGDSPIAIERQLIHMYGGGMHTSVLKLGHHGSRTSSSREYLSAVDPEYAIISASLNNKYGHPHKEVTALLQELKIPEIRTAKSGTIIFKTDGTELRLK